VKIVDIHHHVGSLAHLMGWRRGLGGVEEEQASRVEAMDAAEVEKAIVLPAAGYTQADGIEDTMRVNDAMAAYRDRDPNRFPVACGTVEPLHGERSLDELDRMRDGLGLRGVVWHHRFQCVPIDAGIMRPLYKRAGELGLVPVIHLVSTSHMEAPWRMERVLQDFPEVTFVALDGFGDGDHARIVLEMGKRNPNVLFDTALYNMGPGFLSTVVDAIGSHRVMLGSDLYAQPSTIMPTAGTLVELVRRAGISDADKDNILGLNAKRVFGLE
jgi:predicted TIM-barrel fold metal-dependent hydrolase